MGYSLSEVFLYWILIFQMLVVFKSAPILKRALKVKHEVLQLYVLKVSLYRKHCCMQEVLACTVCAKIECEFCHGRESDISFSLFPVWLQHSFCSSATQPLPLHEEHCHVRGVILTPSVKDLHYIRNK